MSADLWAAFGADDLSSNPWRHPSPDQISAQKVPDADTLERSTDTPVSRAKVKSSAEQQQTQISRVISEKLTPTFKAPISQNLSSKTWDTSGEDRDSWSGWESPSVSADSWTKINAYSDALPPAHPPTDEPSPADNWGDFETPENEFSDGVAALSAQDDSKPPPRSDKAFSTERNPLEEMPHARQGTGQILGDHDQYVDLGSLNSQQFVKATVKEAEATKPPKLVDKQGLHLIDEVVPYSHEEWGEFSPEPSSSHLPDIATSIEVNVQTTNKQPLKPRMVSSNQSTHRKQESTVRAGTSASALPPSNVPPPSILISMVSGLVEKLPVQVDNVMQSLTESRGSSRVLEIALRKCIASLRVAARITAGRKLRWKRDTHLAQSMRIGQAGKGMKLSGVDRNEVKKEDREAAEFVHIWQKHLGSIRRGLALVNSQVAGSPLALPEIAESLAIRTIKVANGGISAPECCALCGIKREERVDKVDVDVYDAFGEWWTDHWGHTECKAFWTEHERYLAQR